MQETMSKKINRKEIRIDTCARCANGTIRPAKDGNPRLVYCAVLGKIFVADSKRKCFYARWL